VLRQCMQCCRAVSAGAGSACWRERLPRASSLRASVSIGGVQRSVFISAGHEARKDATTDWNSGLSNLLYVKLVVRSGET
jgi:hypothetical protein